MSKNKTGVLLINLGSPKELTKKSVREYLRVFLSDDYVLDIPKILQQLILRLFILPFRPKNTLEAYELIWTPEGSPLILSTKSIAKKLSKKTGWDVNYAMRYEDPSIEKALVNFKSKGIYKIIVISLYPHNAMATTITTEMETRIIANKISENFELIFTKPFFDNEIYINTLSNSIKPYIEKSSFDKIIFSYHGIPKKYLLNGDPYHCFCLKTTRLIKEKMGLSDDEIITTFQSRFGKAEWLQPYTSETLKELPKKGIKDIHIISPGFSSDCLETLEELEEENREYFMESGGEQYKYIPCLNDDDEHIDVFVNLIKNNTQGWI